MDIIAMHLVFVEVEIDFFLLALLAYFNRLIWYYKKKDRKKDSTWALSDLICPAQKYVGKYM